MTSAVCAAVTSPPTLGALVLGKNTVREDADGRIKSFAQEIHFEGESGAVNWLVGGYYGHDKIVDSDHPASDLRPRLAFTTAKESIL